MRLPPARVTAAIVIATVAAWAILAVTPYEGDARILGAFIPARASGLIPLAGAVPVWLTPLSSLLLHDGPMHLGFNMLMLGFCGRYVEVALGGRGVLVLYIVGGYAAALGQFAIGPYATAPVIGASGATSALVGAYALLYGERRATVADRRLNTLVNIIWLAAAWIVLQLLTGLAFSTGRTVIAIGAHVGGFLAGLALARPLLLWRYRTA